MDALEAEMAARIKDKKHPKRDAPTTPDASKGEDTTGGIGKKPRLMKRPSGAMADGIMKRPSGAMADGKVGRRPKVPVDADSQEPVLHYLGGKIYDDSKSKRLRCYRQEGDKVEKSISYKTRSRAQCYKEALAAIEEDPRVVG